MHKGWFVVIASGLVGCGASGEPPGPSPDVPFADRRTIFDQGTKTFVVADVDGDGDLDIVAANEGGLVTLLNAGDGSFPTEPVVSVLTRPVNPPEPFPAVPLFSGQRMTAGDFDGDGKLDIAAIGTSDSVGVEAGPIVIAIGNSDGTFAHRTPDFGNYAFRIASSDFDRDGVRDLVAIESPGVINVYFGAAPPAMTLVVPGRTPNGVSGADLDGDGTDDIVHSDGGRRDIAVQRSLGDRTFEPLPGVVVGPFEGTPFADHVATGDFDGDGLTDVVAVALADDENYRRIAVLRSTGTALGPPSRQELRAYLFDFSTGDLDGDGRSDLVMSTSHSFPQVADSIDIVFGQADGTLSPATVVSIAEARHLEIADLDGDGTAEIIAQTRNGITVLANHP